MFTSARQYVGLMHNNVMCVIYHNSQKKTHLEQHIGNCTSVKSPSVREYSTATLTLFAANDTRKTQDSSSNIYTIIFCISFQTKNKLLFTSSKQQFPKHVIIYVQLQILIHLEKWNAYFSMWWKKYFARLPEHVLSKTSRYIDNTLFWQTGDLYRCEAADQRPTKTTIYGGDICARL